MNTKQIVEAIDWVTRDTSIMFDVTVTTPPDDLIRQRAQDNYNKGKPNSLSYDRLSVVLLMEIKKLKKEIEKLKENK